MLAADEDDDRRLSGVVDVLARRGVRARRPEQRLVEGPGADHQLRGVGGLGGLDGSEDSGRVVRP